MGEDCIGYDVCKGCVFGRRGRWDICCHCRLDHFLRGLLSEIRCPVCHVDVDDSAAVRSTLLLDLELHAINHPSSHTITRTNSFRKTHPQTMINSGSFFVGMPNRYGTGFLFSGLCNVMGASCFAISPPELTKHLPTDEHRHSLQLITHSRGCFLLQVALIEFAAAFTPPGPLRSAVAVVVALGDVAGLAAMFNMWRKGYKGATGGDRGFVSWQMVAWFVAEVGIMIWTCFE